MTDAALPGHSGESRNPAPVRKRFFVWERTMLGTFAPSVYYDWPPDRSINATTPERRGLVHLRDDDPEDFGLLKRLYPMPTAVS